MAPLPPSRFVSDPLRAVAMATDSATAEAAHAESVRRLGWSFTLDELRAQRGAGAGTRSLAEPQLMRAILTGKERCFSGAPARALNVFVDDRAPRFVAFDREDRPVALDTAQVRFLTAGLLRQVDADHARFARQYPGSRTVMVPNAHHFVFLANPDAAFEAVRGFLAETDGR